MNPGRAGADGFMRIGNGRQHFIADFDQRGCLPCSFFRFSNHPRQHIADIPGGFTFGNHQRPIVENQAGVKVSGNILCGEYPYNAFDFQRFLQVYRFDDGPRMIGETQRPE